MKIFSWICVGLMIHFLWIGFVDAQGQYVRDSGIDLEYSTITINFTAQTDIDADLLPDFSCFGENDFPVTKALTEIYLSEDDLSRELLYSEFNDSCFHQAGGYDVSLSIQDRAGNAVSSEYSFTITASDVDESQVTYEVSNTSVPADGQTPVTYTMTLRDFAGNPVTQLGSDDITLSIEDIQVDFGIDDSDANRETKFAFGDGLTATDPTVNDAQVAIGFTSVVPTIARVGNLARFKNDVILDFQNIALKKIDDDGTVGNADQSFDPQNDPTIAFRPLLTITPQAVTEEIDDTVNKIYIDRWAEREEPPDFYAADPSHLYFELSGHPNGLTDFQFEVMNADTDHLHYEGQETSAGITTLNPDDFTENGNVREWRTTDSFDLRIGHKDLWTLAPDTSYPLSLYVMGQYELEGNTVRYPMGGSGFDGTAPNPDGGSDIDLTTRNDNVSGQGTLGYHTIWSGHLDEMGADIIGKSLGDIDFVRTSQNTFQVTGESDAIDLRAVMLENAIRLMRGADEDCGNDLLDDENKLDTSDDFEDCEVVVLDFSEENDNFVKIGENLPTGSNTLIVVNGNVRITEDLIYQDETESFGVMAVNIPVEASFPKTGNIFVEPDVQNIHGNFFAEGGFMTNNTGDIADSNPTDAVNQLYFQGTLFSNNTLGGSLTDELQTPWGAVSSSDLPGWASGMSPQKVAQVYDFHFVRSGNDDPIADLENDNAFVVEVVEPTVAPPGFER